MMIREGGGEELKTIMTKNNLTDIWREKNPSVKKYTFRRGNSKSRIDLILISEELSCHIINIKIIHCPFSDHDIKIMKLNVCDITRGSGTWIMNLHTIRSDYFRQVFTNWWVYWKLEKITVADLFLYSYESEFLQKLVKDKKIHEARAFNFTYRYIDDVLSINNSRFAEFLPLIYPPELEVKETTDTASSASFLDLYLEFDDSGQLSTKIYDKRDDFNFKIINFPNMCSNIPASPAYGVYISQLIRYARDSSNYSDFLKRHLHLRNRLLDQGYKKIRLIRSLKKFIFRYQYLVEIYSVSAEKSISDAFSYSENV